MNLTAVHPMKAENIVRDKGLGLCGKALRQQIGDLGGNLPANLPHHEEHGVLHGGIVDGAPVPDSPRNQDVEECCGNAKLPQDLLLGIIYAEGGEQHRILQSEVVLSVVVDTLEPWREGLSRLTQSVVLSGVEGKLLLDEIG